jgi:prepilin-type N-terminal cleavage/methylation domain-containing protein
MKERADQSGFTLIELLIVITILGLIVAALTNGVRFAGQAWQVQERRSEGQGDLDAVQNVLRQLIVSGRNFNGDGVSLRFVATLPDALARGGLYDVELRVLADRLALTWKPHFRGPAAQGGSTSADLVEGVAGLDLAYHVAPGGWQRTAQDANRPPALVRIALQLSDGRNWPPFTVAPMIEARPGVMK